jgi:hypothetical protein
MSRLRRTAWKGRAMDMMGERREWYAYLSRLNLIIVTVREQIAEQKELIAGMKGEGRQLDIEVDYLIAMECAARGWLVRRQFVMGFLSRYPLPPELEAYYDNKVRDGFRAGGESCAEPGSVGGPDPLCDSVGS